MEMPGSIVVSIAGFFSDESFPHGFQHACTCRSVPGYLWLGMCRAVTGSIIRMGPKRKGA